MALIQNKKIHLEYSIDEKRVFGLELVGSEVKSLRLRHGSLDGAKVLVVDDELYLSHAYIPVYQENNNQKLDAYRKRKILCKKQELFEVKNLHHGKNLQIFPISIFLAGRFMKLECGIGKRLKKQDKREVIRKKDENKKGN